MKTLNFQRGFTLVELIMVIVIMGVVGSMMSVFIKSPIDAYFASARRAEMTDVADTTMRRMSRDLKTAVPNTVRTPACTVPDSCQCIEFIPSKTGGRYRASKMPPGAGLVFDAQINSFNAFGDLTDSNPDIPESQKIKPGDVIVVANIGENQDIANAYKQENTSKVTKVDPPSLPTSSPETHITIEPKIFPFESPSMRFQVIPSEENIVAYVCSGGNLHRSVRTLTDSGTCPNFGPILVSNVIFCKFDYDLDRNGIAFASLQVQVIKGDETLTLQHEVHMSISP